MKGRRRVRVSYSESVEDVIHDTYAIEVKYGKQVPAYCRVTSPVVYWYPDGETYLVFTSEDLWILEEHRSDCYIPLMRKQCKYIEAGLTQAQKYDPVKVPLLCLKSPNMQGIVLAMRYMDWFDPKSPQA